MAKISKPRGDHYTQKPAHNSKWEGKGSISSKFLSFSLPNSVISSPLKQQKKAKRKDGHVPSPLYRQHSVALTNLEQLRERHLRRSKSCGEGRTCQPVDFDLLSHAIEVNTQLQETEKRPEYSGTDDHHMHHGMVIQNLESVPCDQDDRFNCGALCLFLPGFGKNAKPVRSRKDIPHPVDHMGVNEGRAVVSQRVSLEKFECGSWRSSAIITNNEDDGDSASNLFFDLPMELMRCSNVNDAELPISTGFVFHKNNKNNTTGKKGGLKNSRLLHSESMSNSCRPVHFSASSPTLYPASLSSCTTPRPLKIREEFNAFLEAQNA
ncbi:uncharacterized protein LOC142540524 [Primulina tabacum]|uniref:uncharacterized protein LOC142540524 n=1 Tax=Primulina tabacum TaxID=48773 RepID=UPI003F599FCE